MKWGGGGGGSLRRRGGLKTRVDFHFVKRVEDFHTK